MCFNLKKWQRGDTYGMKITGIGSAFPDNVVTNEQVAKDLWQRQEDLIKQYEEELIHIIGIEKRIAEYEEGFKYLKTKKNC